MRGFVTHTAGATFFRGKEISFTIRKDYIEYVLKAGKGIYGVVNFLITGDTEVTLFCSWGNFFDRVSNHEDVNKLFKMLEKSCPTLIELFTQDTDFIYVTLPHENNIGGVSMALNIETRVRLMEILAHPDVSSAVYKLFNFNCKLYNEIRTSCPFEGWKKGLGEI